MVGPPSSHIQKFPCLSTAIPSGSVPQMSLATVFKLNLEQVKTVSIEGPSAAVLPKPVGFSSPVAPVPSGRFTVIVFKISTELPFNRIL